MMVVADEGLNLRVIRRDTMHGLAGSKEFRTADDPVAVRLGIAFNHASHGRLPDVQHGRIPGRKRHAAIETMPLCGSRRRKVRGHIRELAHRQPNLDLARVGVADDFAEELAGLARNPRVPEQRQNPARGNQRGKRGYGLRELKILVSVVRFRPWAPRNSLF